MRTDDSPARASAPHARIRPPATIALGVAAAVALALGTLTLLPSAPPGTTSPDEARPPPLGAASAGARWQMLETADGSSVVARHETSGVELDGRIYVIGGRGSRPMRLFDAASLTWRTLPSPPEKLHHFQPVVLDGTIYAIGAMTCCFPEEPSVTTIHAFDTITETWSKAGTVPASRARGGAGAVIDEDWIYVVGGNTRGHSGGAVPWLDRYRPSTGTWEQLPDAPHARDHFQAALVDGRIVAAGGRRSSIPTPSADPVLPVDVYDLASGAWTSEGIDTDAARRYRRGRARRRGHRSRRRDQHLRRGAAHVSRPSTSTAAAGAPCRR